MATFEFRRTQLLKTDIRSAWDFLSSPANLNRITPPSMGFRIISSHLNPAMYPGQIISYKVKVLPLISFNWVTEITHVAEPHYFVDEQRFGPYAFWHHQHHIRETAEGVEMTDIVTYKLPFGLIGTMLAGRMVRLKLKDIFDYRRKVLLEIFPEK